MAGVDRTELPATTLWAIGLEALQVLIGLLLLGFVPPAWRVLDVLWMGFDASIAYGLWRRMRWAYLLGIWAAAASIAMSLLSGRIFIDTHVIILVLLLTPSSRRAFAPKQTWG